MTWTEIKRWAKDKGYNAVKRDDSYIWHKIDDETICGSAISVSKVAKAIFNHMTNNNFLEHQKNYRHE